MIGDDRLLRECYFYGSVYPRHGIAKPRRARKLKYHTSMKLELLRPVLSKPFYVTVISRIVIVLYFSFSLSLSLFLSNSFFFISIIYNRFYRIVSQLPSRQVQQFGDADVARARIHSIKVAVWQGYKEEEWAFAQNRKHSSTDMEDVPFFPSFLFQLRQDRLSLQGFSTYDLSFIF